MKSLFKRNLLNAWGILLLAVSQLLLNPFFLSTSNAAILQSGTNVTYGLVAWWSLDDPSGTALSELSGYGNGATLSGAPTSVTGVISNAYQFDGSTQSASVNYSYAYDITNFTLMCWINTTANGGTILSRNPYAAWEFAINTGRTDVFGAPGEPAFCVGSSWVTAGTAINNGTWQHVAVVVSGGQTTFYINGQLANSSTQTPPSTSSSYGLVIGQRNSGSGGLFLAASLDDIRIYNRPLSAAEIANQFTWRTGAGTLFPITNAPPALVGNTYYIDYSTGSDANTGTTTDAPWQRHPYMQGFTGSYVHQAGDRFIFRGGVTWPGSCFPLSVDVNGAATAFDYYGVSTNYYSGSSWAKPIWDDNGYPLNAMARKSMVYFSYNNQMIDSIVFTNLNWNSSASGVAGVNLGSGTNIVVTNCEFRNIIDNATPASGSDVLSCVAGYSGGSIGTKVSHCYFTCLPNTNWSGQATYYVDTWEYNTVTYMPNGFIGICTTNQYNVVSYIQHSIDTTAHENCIEIFIPQDVKSYIHHNIVTNNLAGELMDISALDIAAGHTATVYVYNNLVANNLGTQTPAIQFDGSAPNSTSSGTRGIAYVWNNTVQDASPAGQSQGYIRVVFRTGSNWQQVSGLNNHYITEGSGGIKLDAGGVTAISEQYGLTNNNAVASAAGYTLGSSWQPMTTNCPTVGHGTNAPVAVFANDLLNRSRLNTSWDIGAYQRLSGALGPAAWNAALHVLTGP